MRQLLTFMAQFDQRKNCSESEQASSAGERCLSVLPEVAATEGQVQRGLAVLFGVFAAVAVIVIILGAISFATAEGNPENISKAKKTIVYALIGLIICLSAEALVLTLLGRL